MRFQYLLGLLLLACTPSPSGQHIQSNTAINGHRGLRGLYPENSLYGFEKTIEHGYYHLEMDVILTADSHLVVFHDPNLNPALCECDYPMPIFGMSLDSLQRYICGTKQQARFPDQELRAHHVPSLKQVFEWGTGHSLKDSIHYVIEIKSPDTYTTMARPSDSLLVAELHSLVAAYSLEERFALQSFDVDILEEAKRQGKDVPLLYLIEEMEDITQALDVLSFTPDIVGLYHPLIDAEVIDHCHAEGISVTAWTVNDKAEIEQLTRLGVDDIMSDYHWE